MGNTWAKIIDIVKSAKFRNYVISSLLAIGAILGLLWKIGEGNIIEGTHTIGDAFKLLGFAGLAIISIVIFVIMALRAIRWELLLAPANARIGMIKASELSYVAWMVNSFVPARLGDLLRIYYPTKIKKVEPGTGIAVIIIEKLLDVIGMLIMLGVGVMFAPELDEGLPEQVSFLLTWVPVMALAGILCIVVVARQERVVAILAKRMPTSIDLKTIFEDYQKYWVDLLKNWWYVIIGIVMAAIVWGSEAVSMKIISSMMDVDIPFPVMLVATAVGLLTFVLPITPGSIGVFEAAVATPLAVYGVDFNDALLIALIHHVMTILILAVVGVPVLYRMGVDSLEMQKEMETPRSGKDEKKPDSAKQQSEELEELEELEEPEDVQPEEDQ